jgi:hypothetical protein
MSIIYDALKKVEKDVTKNQEPESQKPATKYKIYLLYALVLFVGIFTAVIIFKLVSSSASKKLASSPEVAPVEQPASITLGQEALPEPSGPMAVSRLLQKPQPRLTLNGIFFAKDGTYALINSNTVELSYEGSAFTLSTVAQ